MPHVQIRGDFEIDAPGVAIDDCRTGDRARLERANCRQSAVAQKEVELEQLTNCRAAASLS
jgi:hypothetical protein